MDRRILDKIIHPRDSFQPDNQHIEQSNTGGRQLVPVQPPHVKNFLVAAGVSSVAPEACLDQDGLLKPEFTKIQKSN